MAAYETNPDFGPDEVRQTENIQFFKGNEVDLPKGNNIIAGAIYHCTDTKNTYIGTLEETLELYSTSTQIQLYVWEDDD